jgi:hypothetical protein
MIILNLIYDVSIKHMLEDREIAIEFFTIVLEEHVIDLEYLTQEYTLNRELNKIKKSKRQPFPMTLRRLDFRVKIKKSNGDHEMIHLEVQQAYYHDFYDRMQNYISDCYKRLANLFKKDG